MSLLTLLLVLVAAGVILYCVKQFLPMDARIKLILNVVVVVLCLILVLDWFGVIDALDSVRSPHTHRHR